MVLKVWVLVWGVRVQVLVVLLVVVLLTVAAATTTRMRVCMWVLLHCCPTCSVISCLPQLLMQTCCKLIDH
jgi:hypothetical protein